MEKPKILAVVGPTAGGKTALAIRLAKLLSGEVISCDSMQVYRRMDIGTAKPSAEEQEGVRHHLIDIADPADAFSVNDYLIAANEAVRDILSRKKLPIFCGGTGLYLDAFLRGGLPETPAGDPALRDELAALAAQNGELFLHNELRRVDPESADAIHPHNTRRVIRALEIFRLSGVPKSEWDRRSNTLPALYNAAVLGLRFQARDLLYRRIDLRVDQMMENGLLEETRKLDADGVFLCSPTAAGAIGYKELLPYLHGTCALEEAVEQLKTSTRRYAKRQMTWFCAKNYVRWIDMDEGNSLRKSEQIVNNALSLAESAWNML